MIQTERLLLRPWREADRAPFAALNADPQVADWLGGPRDRSASDALIDRLNAQIEADKFGFWAAERKSDGVLVGMIGLRHHKDTPPGPCVELGWRLAHHAWGQGYATEGGRAALYWGFAMLSVKGILAWTAATNIRSQAVMQRIGMQAIPELDFEHPNLPVGDPLCAHVVYGAVRPDATS